MVICKGEKSCEAIFYSINYNDVVPSNYTVANSYSVIFYMRIWIGPLAYDTRLVNSYVLHLTFVSLN